MGPFACAGHGGAIAIAIPAFALAAKHNRSLLGQPINLPASRVIDKRLILGSIAFGIGWGVAGICPGPALVLLGTGNIEAMIFVGTMLSGMIIFEVLQRKTPSGK